MARSVLKPIMRGLVSAAACVVMGQAALAQDAASVARLAQPGAVDGFQGNSDAFIWQHFVKFTAPASPSQPSPVVFETWASDADTFSQTPRWPAGDASQTRSFQTSALLLAKTQFAAPSDARDLRSVAISVPCKAPGNAAVGGFPTHGTPTPCIAEEVRRNRSQFDYIVTNKLNTQAGLAAAYTKALKIEMPLDAISVKVDWVPVPFLLQWLPQLRDADNVRRLYHTTISNQQEYALLSMHVSSRQNPNWVWGTFEHQFNPGRCDSIGCSDTFGAVNRTVLPNKDAINTQYGACPKTPELTSLMRAAGLSQVWENYCLKSTQVDYTAADGTPYVLGNSVIEGIVRNGTIPASSCITCHSYASFGPNGKTPGSAIAMLPFNPSGRTIPAALEGARQFDFMWGVLLAP
ncbi:hypothetical protein [Methylobacterium sp. B4]|uniref:hypothetical protein n=1 Tax=Methylobacterium sp. B4 TaxID=1938755 RepID=UPI0011B3DE17|nr:hypothetical protein [Methylobacterium sp. B4]